MKRKLAATSFSGLGQSAVGEAASHGSFVAHIVLELWHKALIFLCEVRNGAPYVKDRQVGCHSHSSEAHPILDIIGLYAVSITCT